MNDLKNCLDILVRIKKIPHRIGAGDCGDGI